MLSPKCNAIVIVHYTFMEKGNSIEARMFYNLFCEKKEKYLVAGQKYKYLAAFLLFSSILSK